MTLYLSAAMLAISFQFLYGMQCQNEFGLNVDWFIAIRIQGSGREYAILDSLRSQFRLSNEDEVLGRNFGLINPNSDSVIAWNDQPPEGTGHTSSTTYAHSKGLMAVGANDDIGMIISHSIPKYPQIDSDKIDPISPISSEYGQHAICITLKNNGKENALRIWRNLIEGNPNIYFDTLQKKGKEIKPSKETNLLKLELGPFTILTKPRYQVELVFEDILIPYWSNRIAPMGFYLETWGRPYLPSICNMPSQAINILRISILGFDWKNTQDHSKWALSNLASSNLFCASDLNHQESQNKRGGNFFCIRNQEVYRSMRETILEMECGSGLTKYRTQLFRK